MKKVILILNALLFCKHSFAQLAPIGAPPSPSTVPNNANSAWYRGGNFPIGTSPLATNNIFGTFWNSPVYHYTDGALRMTVMGTNTVQTTSSPFAATTNNTGNVGVNSQRPRTNQTKRRRTREWFILLLAHHRWQKSRYQKNGEVRVKHISGSKKKPLRKIGGVLFK